MEKSVKSLKKIDLSQKQITLIAGLGLLIMTIAAIFSEFFVLKKLFNPSDIQATYANILANQNQIHYAIFGYLIVFLMDILVAWALYVFLKKVNKNLSLLTAWFRVIYTVIAISSLFSLIKVLRLLNTPHYLDVFSDAQLQAQISLLIHNFYDAWGVGYVFFGVHLLLLGYLIIKSRFIPKLIGYFVFVAGFTYVIDYLGKFLLLNTNLKFSAMFGWGELLLMFWLLYFGISKKGRSEIGDKTKF